MNLLIIGIGGFLGAVFRYLIVKYMEPVAGSFPLGILLVNVLGSFLLGLLLFLSFQEEHFPLRLKNFLAIGFLGSLTTMSTFAYDSFEMLENGQLPELAINLFCNVFLCLLAIWAGKLLAGYLAG